MRETFDIAAAEARPTRGDVLKALGVGPDRDPPDRILRLVEGAMEIFMELARPRGLVESVAVDEFGTIYRGEGLNEPETPLEMIYPRAVRLALMAATVGDEVSRRIKEAFARNDFAFGYTLDALASEGAETLADRVQDRYTEALEKEGPANMLAAHLRYSPGYCGWHISGQRKLFARLRPDEIGIELNASYLMQPLKSISGVVVSGDRDIHLFKNDYPFCSECTTKSCRQRLKLIMSTA